VLERQYFASGEYRTLPAEMPALQHAYIPCFEASESTRATIHLPQSGL